MVSVIIKRVYNPKKYYPYYFHPEIGTWHEFEEFKHENPNVACEFIDNADYVMELQTHEEQNNYWTNCIRRIMLNTREVLDNLEYFSEFKVRWNHYGLRLVKGNTIGKPPIKITEQCDTLYNKI